MAEINFSLNFASRVQVHVVVRLYIKRYITNLGVYALNTPIISQKYFFYYKPGSICIIEPFAVIFAV